MRSSTTWCVRDGLRLMCILPLIALGTACHPGEPTGPAQLDVVATAHDDTVNFASIGTFVMPDSVVAIVPPESVATTLPFDHTYDQLILGGGRIIKTKMGYNRLPTFD